MVEPIPILFTTDLVGLGGGEVSLLSHLKHLERSKFTPFLLCTSYGPLAESAIKADVRVDFLCLGKPRLYGGVIPYFPIQSVLKLREFIRGRKIGLVHTNSFNTMMVASLAVRSLRVPVLWTCHGWWPARRLTGFYVNRLVDKVVAVSGAVKEKLIGPGSVKPSAIEIIYPGVECEKYQASSCREAVRAEFSIDPAAPLVGMVARFQAIKGHKIFIHCASMVKEKLNGAKFIIVGAKVFRNEDDEEYEEEVLQLIKERGLEKDVLLTGFREDVPSIMSALDVLVVPSLMETFGVVAVEGMAAGLPVVASRVGGLCETIIDGVSGLLVEAGRPEQFAHAVVRLLENQRLREALAEQGRKRVAEKFNIRLQTQRIEQVYSNLLGRHNRFLQ